MPASISLYDSVISVTMHYVDRREVAERLVNRQLNRLNLKAEELKKEELQQLAYWIYIAVKLKLNDDEKIKGLEQSILSLAN